MSLKDLFGPNLPCFGRAGWIRSMIRPQQAQVVSIADPGRVVGIIDTRGSSALQNQCLEGAILLISEGQVRQITGRRLKNSERCLRLAAIDRPSELTDAAPGGEAVALSHMVTA